MVHDVEIIECKLYMCIDDTKNTRDNPVSMTQRIQNARPCMEKMQFIFFVPPNEELEGTFAPPKNAGKRVRVPLDEKTCGYAGHCHMSDRPWE